MVPAPTRRRACRAPHFADDIPALVLATPGPASSGWSSACWRPAPTCRAGTTWQTYASNDDATAFDGPTPISAAAREGRLPVVLALLARGASMDRGSPAPLISAAEFGPRPRGARAARARRRAERERRRPQHPAVPRRPGRFRGAGPAAARRGPAARPRRRPGGGLPAGAGRRAHGDCGAPAGRACRGGAGPGGAGRGGRVGGDGRPGLPARAGLAGLATAGARPSQGPLGRGAARRRGGGAVRRAPRTAGWWCWSTRPS